MNNLDDTIKRIATKHSQVEGILILNPDCQVIRSTYPED